MEMRRWRRFFFKHQPQVDLTGVLQGATAIHRVSEICSNSEQDWCIYYIFLRCKIVVAVDIFY